MPNDFYAKGTIKVRNQDNMSVPFMPNTDTENVVNDSGSTLKTVISNLEQRTTAAAQKGGIKVMYEEPTSQNTSTFTAKTLIGYVLPEEWKFQVKSTRLGEKKAAIPIYLYNQPGITLYVDWGDGNTSTLTSSNYTKTDGSASIHTYSEQNKIYTISIASHDWHKLYLYASSNISGAYSTSSSPDGIIGCFKLSLYKILNPIPKVKGIQYYTDSAYSTTKADNSFAYLFSSCSYSLQSDAYPENLFEKNLDAVSFEYCFCHNGRVSIPKKLFKGMSSAKNFQYCFYYSNIISIPEGLFDDCISALNFDLCFGFTQINLIPQQLFYNNTEATSFIGCFANVGTFNDFTLHIGSAKVLSCGDFVTEKENAVRIIYVPSGSTTETAFNSIASSLGLTIIAE